MRNRTKAFYRPGFRAVFRFCLSEWGLGIIFAPNRGEDKYHIVEAFFGPVSLWMKLGGKELQ